MKFLPFAVPDIGEEEIAEVVVALRSGWLTTGPKTKQFEHDFADFIGGGVTAVAVNSATAGLHLALEAVGIGAGDEVITTPYTFTATAAVIEHLGARPVFADVDPRTFNLDPEKVAAAVTPRTKAILPVHFAGLACEMPALIKLARRHSLFVIEDAAHALPTTCGGKLIGALDTDATVYSFYATKTITTGEGGMIVTRHPQLAERCRVMRLHGISRDVFDRYTSDRPAWHYEVIAPGFKYNLSDLASSIGIQQLKKAWAFQQRRQAMAERYDAEFRHLPLTLPPSPPSGEVHARHLYVIRLADTLPIERDEFIRQMAARSIGCSVHFIPLQLHPYWRGLQPPELPQSLRCYERAVSLPLYTKMSEADQTRVIEAVKKVVASAMINAATTRAAVAGS